MKKKTKTIKVDDQQIPVTIQERGTETVWVFLHGWGSERSVWRQITKSFLATTVTTDLPGFGEASDLRKPWSVDDYSSAIRKLIEQLGYNSVVLVGHSFGGQVAARIAGDQPDWLSGLVLVGPAAIRTEEPKLLSTIGSIVSPLFQLPLINKLRPLIYRLIGADIPPEDENLKQTMRNILREDQTDELKQISLPTLIVWGDEDTKAPTSQSGFVAEQIENAELSILSGGHFVFIDVPDKFRNELQAFNTTIS